MVMAQATVHYPATPGFMAPTDPGITVNNTKYPLGFCRALYQFAMDGGGHKLNMVAWIFQVPLADCQEIVKRMMKNQIN